MHIITVTDSSKNIIGEYEDIKQASDATGISERKIMDYMDIMGIYSESFGKDLLFNSMSAEPLEITVVPQVKPFPETWDIMIGAFHNDLFTSLEKKEDMRQFVDDVYRKATETKDCGVFNYASQGIEEYMLNDNIFNYFLFPIDQSFGALGVMQLSNFFLLETVLTREIHFCVKVEWRCSFSNFSDIKDKLSEKKRQGYDIRVGKYMQIELMKLMKSLLTDKSKREKMQLNFKHIKKEIENEDIRSRITKISVFSCSLDNAFDKHTSNGARVVSEENKKFYRRVRGGKDLLDLHYNCDPYLKFYDISDLGLKLIYWNDKIV